MACLSSLPRVLLQICTCIEIFLPILFILALMGLRLATLALDSKELCVRPMPNVRAHNMTFHWYPVAAHADNHWASANLLCPVHLKYWAVH